MIAPTNVDNQEVLRPVLEIVQDAINVTLISVRVLVNIKLKAAIEVDMYLSS